MGAWGSPYAGGSRMEEIAKVEPTTQRQIAAGLGIGGLAAMRIGGERELRSQLNVARKKTALSTATARAGNAAATAESLRGKQGPLIHDLGGKPTARRFTPAMARGAAANAAVGAKAAERAATIATRQHVIRARHARRLRYKGTLALVGGGALALNSLRRPKPADTYGGYPYA